MPTRACVACPNVYFGGLGCPDCGEPGEPIDDLEVPPNPPLRPHPGVVGDMIEVFSAAMKARRGRPPIADKRRIRNFRASDAEYAQIQANAKAAGLSLAAFVRLRCS